MKNTFTSAQIVSMAYASIEKCGLYQDDCREWSRKPSLEKTWINFKDHLARAFKETRISFRISNNEGYASNVQYTQANVALFTKMQQDHTVALKNLTTETQADRTSVVLLIKTIAEISSQVTTITSKLATSQSKNTRLKISGHLLAPSNHRNHLANVGPPYDQNPLHDRNIYSRNRKNFDPNRYCSSHGFKVEESHTSATCRYPVYGHKKLATQQETKGGNTWNTDWINGRPTE